jgi:hypothetical protein
MAVFWDVVPRSVVHVYWRFRDAFCLHQLITLTMRAVSISETSIKFYETTKCNTPEDSSLQDSFKFISIPMLCLHLSSLFLLHASNNAVCTNIASYFTVTGPQNQLTDWQQQEMSTSIYHCVSKINTWTLKCTREKQRNLYWVMWMIQSKEETW